MKFSLCTTALCSAIAVAGMTALATAQQSRSSNNNLLTAGEQVMPIGGSNCCFANGSPGCDDPDCEATVCGQDAFCCDVEWDQLCADAAANLCDICEGSDDCAEFACPEDITGDGSVNTSDLLQLLAAWGDCPQFCPDGTTDEKEPCGDDTNGGCNSVPPVFGSITCDETICGNAWADGGTRDTDWFQITVEEPTELTATLVSQFNGVVFIIDGIDTCVPVVIGETGAADNCASIAPAVACVDAGTYVVFVAPAVFDGIPCNSGSNAYYVSLECSTPCEPPPPPCPGEGDCCVPNGSVGCNDEACCELICGQDPFCCDTEWDQLCADAANQQCGKVCGDPGSNCCFPNGTPGCDDPDCEALICGQDPFCCDVEWDGLCSGAALEQCAVCQ